MMSIPEIAAKIIDESYHSDDNNARTIFLAGSKSVGKSTLLYSFLDKMDTPKETLVLEYSFGRKTNQKQGLEKSVCHLWEYGGKLEKIKSILPHVPIQGDFYYIVMVDLSKFKTIWSALETCIQAVLDADKKLPEIIIVGGKYDLFKNYDVELKKFICTTIRSVALLANAHVIFYSSKEQPLAKRMKDILHSIGFGSSMISKEKNTNVMKPLFVPKGSDTWESIGLGNSTLEQIKLRHLTRIPPQPMAEELQESAPPCVSHPEPELDSVIVQKMDQLKKLYAFNADGDFLMNLQY